MVRSSHEPRQPHRAAAWDVGVLERRNALLVDVVEELMEQILSARDVIAGLKQDVAEFRFALTRIDAALDAAWPVNARLNEIIRQIIREAKGK